MSKYLAWGSYFFNPLILYVSYVDRIHFISNSKKLTFKGLNIVFHFFAHSFQGYLDQLVVGDNCPVMRWLNICWI